MQPTIKQAFTHESNYGNGAGGRGTYKGRKFIIIHGSGRQPQSSAERELAFLQTPGIQVSYHYYITKEGEIYQLVPNEMRAWHAGSSAWTVGKAQYTDLNDWSVGIALESTNGIAEEYPTEQVSACLWLTEKLMQEFDVCAEAVLSHREISVPVGRKIDPVNFDMHGFRFLLHGPKAVRLPAYHPVTNVYLGDVTVINGEKVYPTWLKRIGETE